MGLRTAYLLALLSSKRMPLDLVNKQQLLFSMSFTAHSYTTCCYAVIHCVCLLDASVTTGTLANDSAADVSARSKLKTLLLSRTAAVCTM